MRLDRLARPCGSVVNDGYRSNLADQAGSLDPGAVHVASEGVDIASRVAATPPADGAVALTRTRAGPVTSSQADRAA